VTGDLVLAFDYFTHLGLVVTFSVNNWVIDCETSRIKNISSDLYLLFRVSYLTLTLLLLVITGIKVIKHIVSLLFRWCWHFLSELLFIPCISFLLEEVEIVVFLH
jgi:hypothetical protein